MPQALELPPAVTGRARHCVAVNFNLPVGVAPSCSAEFVIREALSDGSTRELPDGSCTLGAAEIAALPVFADAYTQLAAALHAKRATFAE